MDLPQIIQKTWNIRSNITRIGINNALNRNINRSPHIPILFIPNKCIVEKKGIEVNKNQVIACLYNKKTRCQYLFYSPIKGTIINRNESIINNLDTIYINETKDNWLIDIEHCKENNDENKIKSKYYWWY